MTEQRRILGVVTRIRHRGSMLAATVKPLAISSIDCTCWETDLTTGRKPTEEFPNAGRLSWLHPDGVEVGTVWEFSVKEQPSYYEAPTDPIRDRFMLDPASVAPATPVIELTRFGDEHAGRLTLTRFGVTLPDDSPRKYWIRSEGNLWQEVELVAGDIEFPDTYVMPVPKGGITRWVEWTPDVEPFELCCDARCIQTSFKWALLPPGAGPTGPPRLRDWSSDEKVLQHLMRTLRKADQEFAEQMSLTEASIARSAHVLSSGTTGISNPGLEKARLDRVENFVRSLNAGEKAARAAMTVIEESPIADILAQQKAEILNEARKSARTKAERELKKEKTDLERIRKLIADGQNELHQIARQVEAARAKREEQIKGLEDNLADRLADVLDNAEELVASSALIRVISGTQATERPSVLESQLKLDVTDNEPHDQNEALNQLCRALRNRDVPHELASPLLAGFLGGLVPVLSGSRALSALSAFADCVTSGRIDWIPVSPGWIDPSDFLGRPQGAEQNHPCGLLEVLTGARKSDHLHLVILDGINVGPMETILSPILTCMSGVCMDIQARRSLPVVDARDHSQTRVPWPDNVLLAATTHRDAQFSVPSTVWDRAFYLCCDAVSESSLASTNNVHPDKRSASIHEALGSISASTWRQWRQKTQDNPLVECANLLSQTSAVAGISRPARDCAKRFFAAASETQKVEDALRETFAFALFAHIVDGETDLNDVLEGKTPPFYDGSAAAHDFLKLSGLS